MRVQRHRVAGEQVTITVAETRDDLEKFRRWIADNAARVIAFDTETTGLDWFAPDFRLRLAQMLRARSMRILSCRNPLAAAKTRTNSGRHQPLEFCRQKCDLAQSRRVRKNMTKEEH